ncbi:MAG: Gfo/Idh/MocA family protein [Mycobacteriales bacterium]
MTAARTVRTIPGDAPLRAAVVGAGGMGKGWISTVAGSPLVELVGVVDLDESAALAAAPDGVPVGTSLGALAAQVGAEVVIDVTVPEAHLPVTLEALGLGLPVLGEKPLAASMAAARQLMDAAEKSGELFMVSQNRRFNPLLFDFKHRVDALGGAQILTHEFFKAPHFGGFRDAMEHPLLLDMAIHNFDAARFVLGGDAIAVYCEEYNPSWSWYDGAAAATLIAEFAGGARYVYTGSWCSEGLETSWDTRWRASCPGGSAVWDGDHPAESEPAVHGVPPAPPANGIEGSLAAFVHALRTGEAPMGECHDNLQSLALVHAAIASADQGRKVTLEEVLTAARP